MPNWETVSVDVHWDREQRDFFVSTTDGRSRGATPHEAVGQVIDTSWELVSASPTAWWHHKSGVVTTGEECLVQRLWFKRPTQ